MIHEKKKKRVFWITSSCLLISSKMRLRIGKSKVSPPGLNRFY